LTASELIVSKP